MPKPSKASNRPPAPTTDLTQTMRDYLKSAYRLQIGDTALTVTALADLQHVAPASATAMVKKLASLGLMEHQHYGTILLTEAGIKQALLAIRRHRLVECCLVRIFKYSLDECHEDAHILEPAISDRFENRIDVALGHPRHCPHGDPIPDRNGNMDADLGFPLTDLGDGRSATISRVPGSKPDLLRYLLDLGIEPDRPICLLKREPFGGPLHLKLGRRTVMLGPEAAQMVYVTEAES